MRNQLDRMENLQDGKMNALWHVIYNIEKNITDMKPKAMPCALGSDKSMNPISMDRVLNHTDRSSVEKNMKDSAKKLEEINKTVCKISSQMNSLKAEFKMHFPDELSNFLSEKQQPQDVLDIESDEDK